MAVFRTNMVSTKNKQLIIASSRTAYLDTADINKWDDEPKDLYAWTEAADKFNIQTKDIDFGDPSRRKKIYKVYVTFKAGGYMSGVIAKYATNGSNTFNGTFEDTTYYSSTKGFDSFNGSQENSSDDWITVALKPTTTLVTKNIYSMQLKFEWADAGRVNTLYTDSSTGSVLIYLDGNANDTTAYYDGMPLYIYKGAGSGYIYRITHYEVNTLGAHTANTQPVGVEENPNTTSGYDVGFIPKEFAINDINIVYREKAIK